jgi:DNA-binding response OmpR family regulator
MAASGGDLTTAAAPPTRRRILLVDDNQDFRRLLRDFLRRLGHVVAEHGAGSEALQAAAVCRPGIVVSDVQMPKMDGFELCRRLRACHNTADLPIVLISGASREERDQLEGYSCGADDYVLKPFPAPILMAKIEAVLRRYANAAEAKEFLRADGVLLDVQGRMVNCGERKVKLTRKEFDLLTLLLRRRGHVLPLRFLLESVWGCDPADSSDPHTVTVHLSSLRQKLGSRLGRRIVSVPGSGYSFKT